MCTRALRYGWLLAALGLSACPEKPRGLSETQQAAARGPASKPAAPGTTPDDRDAVDADGVVRRGTALTQAKALTVPEVFAQADILHQKPIKVSGAADKVCQNQGCWFTLLAEDGRFIRVVSKDHGFFIPSKVRSMQATAEGNLEVKVSDQKDPKGERELVLFARGLEMKMPAGG